MPLKSTWFGWLQPRDRCAADAAAQDNIAASGASAAALIEHIVLESEALNAQCRFGQSLAMIAKGLEADAGSARLLFAKAVTLFQWRRFREAKVYLDRASAAGLHRAELVTCLGWTCFQLGRHADAERYLRQVVQEFGSTPTAPRRLAACSTRSNGNPKLSLRLSAHWTFIRTTSRLCSAWATAISMSAISSRPKLVSVA